MEVVGKIKRIGAIEQVSDSFKKAYLDLETDEQYPQILRVELFQDKTDLIKAFQVGDVINAQINLRGREWQKDAQSEVRVFVSLNAWALKKVDNESNVGESLPSGDIDDDLPF